MPLEQQEEIANPATEILLCLLEYRPLRQQIGQDLPGVVDELLKALLGRMVGGLGEPGEGIEDWLQEEDVSRAEFTLQS